MGLGEALSALARFEPGAWWVRVLVGFGFAIGVLLLRWALSFAYGSITGFMILLPGVILAAVAAGRVAGVAAVTTALLGGWLVVGPDGAGVGVTQGLGQIATFNFIVVGLFCTWMAASLRDVVTRLSTTDAALDEGERRFRDISDVAPVMLWSADALGRLYVNAEFRAFWGERSMDADDMTAWIQAIHPDDRDRVVAASKRALARREAIEMEARYLRHDGQWRTLKTFCRPRSGPDAGFLGMVGANVDVTDARAGEARLRESEARFRLMADTAPSPVWMTNPDAEVEFVNQALVEFYGQPADEILGHVWKQAVHPDDQPHVVAAMAAARPQRLPYGFECRFLHAGGGWRWMRVAVKPRFDGAGQFMGYVGMAFDVTETREALDALAELEKRQTFLLSLSDRLRDLTDPEAVIGEVSRNLAGALGARRVGYGEIDDVAGQITVRGVWSQEGLPDLRGVWRMDDFGPDLIAALRRGEPARVDDVAEDPLTAASAAAFAAIGARSVLGAPVLRGGRFRAFLFAHDEARRWTDAEAALIEDVAARAFAEVERTRAEAEVRESEQRFRAVADTAPVLIWVTDADRTRAFVNQAYVTFNGGAYEDARLADWRAVLHPDDQERILSESVAGEATGAPFSLEARYRRHDGEWRWLKSFSRPRFGAADEVIGFVGVAFDVTDIRESAERLANAAAERDAILGQLAEGVIVTDTSGRIVFVNEAAARHHGVERLDIAPEDYSETYHLFTEAGAPYPFDDLPLARAVMKGETVLDARWRIRRPDGSEVLAVGNARPVFADDGRRIGAVLTLRDETARVEAENRLAESETRFRTVADSAPALIWMLDAKGVPSFANRRYQAFFGIDSVEDMIDGWTRLALEPEASAFTQEFTRAFSAREEFEGLVRVAHPALGERWLRCEAIPRFDAGGMFQGYVGANLDVTEAKQAEADLKRINELLEDRVGDALAEKAKAEADLMHAQRMEAVGRLTGGVAHDFNNLLTVVIGALDMMLRAPEDAPRQKRLGEAALAAARRGERLTHQLLAFSRRQTLRPEPTDLNALILEGEPLLRRAVGEAVTLDLRLVGRPVWVNVDPAQFEAALLNLIVNARDAVSEGGRVTIETRVRRLRAGQVADLPGGDHVSVSVIDDGAGIDPEVLPRVFEPFFTTKSVGKGTGLGLSQVYGFTRQSGGAVDVESHPGQGTAIRILLPALRRSGAGVPTAAPEAGRPTRPGRRLLLVEDDAAVAAVAAEMVESLGFTVRTADHAADALTILEGESFDVMLTDLVMPGGMSGVELARLTSERHPRMSVVLASGYAGDDVDRLVDDAPWPFVKKPYSRESLAEALTGEAV